MREILCQNKILVASRQRQVSQRNTSKPVLRFHVKQKAFHSYERERVHRERPSVFLKLLFFYPQRLLKWMLLNDNKPVVNAGQQQIKPQRPLRMILWQNKILVASRQRQVSQRNTSKPVLRFRVKQEAFHLL
jgi:hypothetical protein